MRGSIKIVLLVLISLILFIFCKEKIPEGPERTEILEVSLLTRDKRTDFAQENHWDLKFKLPPKKMTMVEFENLSTWQVPFILWIHNDFDEAMEGQKWINIKINIWPADENEHWVCQLNYADTISTRQLTIPPGDSVPIYSGTKLIWDQHNEEGNSIHETELFRPMWIECTEFDSVFKNPPGIIGWRHCDTTKLAPVDTVIAFLNPKKIYAQADVQLFKNYHVVKSNVVEFYIHYFSPADGFKKKFWCVEGRQIPGDPPCPFGWP